MDNTNQKKALINSEIALFLRGLIIGKVLTLMVIGGLLWWLLKPNLLSRNSVNSSTNQSYKTVSNTTSSFQTVADVPTASFNYGGSTAWASIRQLVDSQIQSDRPELQLRYVAPVMLALVLAQAFGCYLMGRLKTLLSLLVPLQMKNKLWQKREASPLSNVR